MAEKHLQLGDLLSSGLGSTEGGEAGPEDVGAKVDGAAETEAKAY